MSLAVNRNVNERLLIAKRRVLKAVAVSVACFLVMLTIFNTEMRYASWAVVVCVCLMGGGALAMFVGWWAIAEATELEAKSRRHNPSPFQQLLEKTSDVRTDRHDA
jgi:small neutral amino acid transporter SnatA (MarC family)